MCLIRSLSIIKSPFTARVSLAVTVFAESSLSVGIWKILATSVCMSSSARTDSQAQIEAETQGLESDRERAAHCYCPSADCLVLTPRPFPPSWLSFQSVSTLCEMTSFGLLDMSRCVTGMCATVPHGHSNAQLHDKAGEGESRQPESLPNPSLQSLFISNDEFTPRTKSFIEKIKPKHLQKKASQCTPCRSIPRPSFGMLCPGPRRLNLSIFILLAFRPQCRTQAPLQPQNFSRPHKEIASC